MRIAVFGSGYVGLVTGACFADVGHEVIGVDTNTQRVADLNRGSIPIFEPGLEEMITSNMNHGRLNFTQNASEALAGADIAYIAVGTPQKADGSADLTYVLQVARTIGELATDDLVVVDKSTVPVGTAEKVQREIDSQLASRRVTHRIRVCSNPEFLKEGAAIEDFKHGARIVIGTDSAEVERAMRECYEPYNRQHDKMIIMDIKSAELTKYAANAMLATKISFINEMANIAERTGADIEQVRIGIGSDPRIGYQFLYPGAGYGGSCFPKDVAALSWSAREAGYEPTILDAVEVVNRRQKQFIGSKLSSHFNDLNGKTIAIWGLSFKPKTDDIRDAASLELISFLLENGAKIRAYDPVAMENVRARFAGEVDLVLVDEKYDAIEGADALAICTEWEEFRTVDGDKMAELMRGRLVVDGRNLYSRSRLSGRGFTYVTVGRPTLSPITQRPNL
ncbi:UDPglucose 6-dehydrogenase [Brevibacterium sp. Mu109]|uniref:UDP-glucose dehydrogenase family protein n=1 Tax=Brevibacterium sp. Mu109 TaxID=1255669 RepID=UPI000C6422F2|nr:UDP-glucose/GDP-mannose dehydrogenase family protein [Brevibacterium sp. Mu109]SMX95583.1 UDPglucose 6-dehydrogenase [Brevibacterium sp. Mu109]